MKIHLKRIYDDPASDDGYRVLVDRLWPRGVSKEDAKLDDWLKSAAPSDDLRKWFDHDPERWQEFRERYLGELKEKREDLRPLAERARQEKTTLLFGAKDEEHNNAVVLAQYLEMLS